MATQLRAEHELKMRLLGERSAAAHRQLAAQLLADAGGDAAAAAALNGAESSADEMATRKGELLLRLLPPVAAALPDRLASKVAADLLLASNAQLLELLQDDGERLTARASEVLAALKAGNGVEGGELPADFRITLSQPVSGRAATAASGAPARPRPPAVPLSALHAAAVELCTGNSAVALAALEAALPAALLPTSAGGPAPEFADLGHGPSLLALLERQPKLAEALAGSADGGAGGSHDLSHVLHTTAQAKALASRAPAEQAGALVSAALCAHYGVSGVPALGHGPVARLIREAPDAPAASLVSAAVLAADTDGGMAPHAFASADATPQMALDCLRVVPALADLRAWTAWDAMFAASIGPLEAFLASRGPELGFAALECRTATGWAAAPQFRRVSPPSCLGSHR